MLRMLPALPMLRMLPALPILKIEPALPMLRILPALKRLPTLRRLPTLKKLPTLRMLPALRMLLARPPSPPDRPAPDPWLCFIPLDFFVLTFVPLYFVFVIHFCAFGMRVACDKSSYVRALVVRETAFWRIQHACHPHPPHSPGNREL